MTSPPTPTTTAATMPVVTSPTMTWRLRFSLLLPSILITIHKGRSDYEGMYGARRHDIPILVHRHRVCAATRNDLAPQFCPAGPVQLHHGEVVASVGVGRSACCHHVPASIAHRRIEHTTASSTRNVCLPGTGLSNRA